MDAPHGALPLALVFKMLHAKAKMNGKTRRKTNLRQLAIPGCAGRARIDMAAVGDRRRRRRGLGLVAKQVELTQGRTRGLQVDDIDRAQYQYSQTPVHVDETAK